MNPRTTGRLMIPALVAAASLAVPQTAFAQRDMVTVPSDTVVQLKLDQRLSSRDSVVGETFAAVLDEDDRSGFPEGTRFQGVVTEVQRHTKDRPGLLDVEFRRAYLPDGQKITMDGRLASLEEDSVRRTDNGRLESRKRGGGGSMDWKWAGIGAGAGLILGTIFGGGGSGSLIKGAILGGLGGAAYGYLNRDKGKSKDYRDVDLPRGTEFGMLLDRRVAFDDRSGYRYTTRNVEYDRYNDRTTERRYDDRDRYADRDRYNDDRYRDDRTNDRYDDRYTDRRYQNDRVLGDRLEGRLSDATVRVDGRSVYFDNQRPREINGVLYVPLAPIAEAANMRFTHRQGAENFVLDTRNGLIDGRAGDSRVYVSQNESVRLTDQPMLLGNTIFVSREFLDKAARLRTDWDSTRNTLNIETR